jgi:UDP-N-acetylglucosamine diphosphorylase / glucose-1-phosphate thymidylyltransferase / UDP-N-acetylgalactosamine diphosphorylase / glucosamine-1-phosphate N-acetyltransferase / galactosamine-1-phosphate N-acetyltransferase
MATLCIFEDEGYQNFLPLTYSRPSYELKCGMRSLMDKIEEQYPRVETVLHVRDYLAEALKRRNQAKIINNLSKATECLFINGRLLADENTAARIPLRGEDEVFLCQGNIVAARCSNHNLENIKNKLGQVFDNDIFSEIAKKTEIECGLADCLWQLVNENGKQIAYDFSCKIRNPKIKIKLNPYVSIDKPNLVHIEDGAVIEPFVNIVAAKGPVIIDKDVIIRSFSRIEGPAYIGKNSLVSGGYIGPNASIGNNCKIGGEVVESIFHGYSNKQHYGFLGHSYIGEWVNLGAGTTNSNLKNNYRSVKTWQNGARVDTGQIFAGCFIGDHSKLGIGTLISAGSVIGVSANFFGGGLTPKYLPSFTWGTTEKTERYNFEKALQTAQAMMLRRKVEPAESDIKVLQTIYNLSGE